MTCRDEILACVMQIARRKKFFTFEDIYNCMRTRGTEYRRNTIRTNVVSRMCVDAPKNHARKYDDLERVSKGYYRLAQ